MPIGRDNPTNGKPLLLPAEAHGQAALVLVESLIHGLVRRSILTTGDAVEIIEAAQEVQAEVAEEANGAGAKMWQAHALLDMMASSLKLDIEDATTENFR